MICVDCRVTVRDGELRNFAQVATRSRLVKLRSSARRPWSAVTTSALSSLIAAVRARAAPARATVCAHRASRWPSWARGVFSRSRPRTSRGAWMASSSSEFAVSLVALWQAQPRHTSRDAIRDMYTSLFDAIGDAEIRLLECIAQNNKAALILSLPGSDEAGGSIFQEWSDDGLLLRYQSFSRV